jgi:signal peptidase I
MAPRLIHGEKILVEELTPGVSAIARGDILVFRHPDHSDRYVIKRVVALGGEILEIRHGRLFIDGGRVREWYLSPSSLDDSDYSPTRVGASELFVMGDHRDDSEDSRHWGPLRQDLIVGRATVSYWPPGAASYLRR